MDSTPAAMAGLAVTGWSAVSPLGIGAEQFAAGVRAGRSAVAPLDRQEWPGPLSEACLVPGFSVSGVLGSKGTRSMDRATGLAITAVDMLLEQQDGDLVEAAEGHVGLVLGTSTGSIQSIMDFTRDSLTQDKPYYVDPARFPNTVMNCAAGQCAIWHGLKGPNTTIAGGAITSLLALNYATRLQRCGYVETLLCGAVEEFSVQRSWLEWHSHAENRTGWPPGEGCAVFLLEPAAVARSHGREVLAEVLALEFGAYDEDARIGAGLARCIRTALEGAGSTVHDVWAIAPSEVRGTLGEQEHAAVEDVFGDAGPTCIGTAKLLGDTSAASAAFQLAAVLATAQDLSEARGRAALVTSVDRDGMLGCALLRITGSPPASGASPGPEEASTGRSLRAAVKDRRPADVSWTSLEELKER